MEIQNQFKGKAIYNPSGKAGEYSYWACNLYVGCSNGCTYCYLKKGRVSKILGGDKPTLKKCFKNEVDAMQIFVKELRLNLEELKKHGLFFSFTTDPMLKETKRLTIRATQVCNLYGIPVKVLTKESEYIYLLGISTTIDVKRNLIAVGVTLTGHDELETNASSNIKRIQSLKIAKESGYKTFASIEPIIDFESSKRMIELVMPYCGLLKIGLESGKNYNKLEAQEFIEWLIENIDGPKVYLKESIQKLTGYTNKELDDFCVERDYNIFLN